MISMIWKSGIMWKWQGCVLWLRTSQIFVSTCQCLQDAFSTWWLGLIHLSTIPPQLECHLDYLSPLLLNGPDCHSTWLFTWNVTSTVLSLCLNISQLSNSIPNGLKLLFNLVPLLDTSFQLSHLIHSLGLNLFQPRHSSYTSLNSPSLHQQISELSLTFFNMQPVNPFSY